MWIFLNDSFLSIVAHRTEPGVLLVRARTAGDIEAVFPQAHVREGEGTDYRFRADVQVEEVALALAERVRGIGDPNFKDSVRERSRHDAYMDVWSVMARWGRRSQAKGMQ
jgi:hypothetical protein